MKIRIFKCIGFGNMNNPNHPAKDLLYKHVEFLSQPFEGDRANFIVAGESGYIRTSTVQRVNLDNPKIIEFWTRNSHYVFEEVE
ncbi:hypothetical protein HB852_09915 [Listeria grandensis]|uniref:hypothetical protein n=1 Tax=Listeria grandensis TaxID=1494963 RepID=UPI001623FB04|nr:hypothetical protein [Listeria grandensis]MBC1474933.1 hypothetical protein [Listeria grandensis]